VAEVEAARLKHYDGRIPACGVFCGGCPVYTRDKKPCPGAEINSARCDGCKSFHLCCIDHGVEHCCDCGSFPCRRFKDFSRRWLKYGQDLTANQRLMKEIGAAGLAAEYNSRAAAESD
jgi:putative acetyltransferase